MSALTAIREKLSKPEWSPYLSGVGLGVVVTLSLGIYEHRLSGAGAYQHLSGYVGRLLAPRSMYWSHVVPTGVTWDVVVTIGAVLGAAISALASGSFRIRTMPDRQWTDAFGSSVALRWIIAFVGCFLSEIGAGIAGGCTASLVVSGGAVMAPGAFIFMAGMFGAGIPVAWLVHRRRRDAARRGHEGSRT